MNAHTRCGLPFYFKKFSFNQSYASSFAYVSPDTVLKFSNLVSRWRNIRLCKFFYIRKFWLTQIFKFGFQMTKHSLVTRRETSLDGDCFWGSLCELTPALPSGFSWFQFVQNCSRRFFDRSSILFIIIHAFCCHVIVKIAIISSQQSIRIIQVSPRLLFFLARAVEVS